MKVVLFGGAGFLGRVVARRLRAQGETVLTVDRRPGEADLAADITDRASLEALPAADADVVVNLAARLPGAPDTLPEHAELFEVNAVGAANVAQWAAARHARRLVYGSTLVVVARPWPVPLTEAAATYPVGPVAAYAASKLGGELVGAAIAAAAGVSFAALRFSALYGPGMQWTGVLPAFIDGALGGRRLSAAAGPRADFLHVEDAARAVAAAAGSSATGVFNIAAGVETSIVELAAAVLSACGRPADAVDVTAGVEARAVVDVTRLRTELECGGGTPLAEGVAQLVQTRRGPP